MGDYKNNWKKKGAVLVTYAGSRPQTGPRVYLGLLWLLPDPNVQDCQSARNSYWNWVSVYNYFWIRRKSQVTKQNEYLVMNLWNTEQSFLRLWKHPPPSLYMQQPVLTFSSFRHFWFLSFICRSYRIHGEYRAPKWIKSAYSINKLIFIICPHSTCALWLKLIIKPILGEQIKKLQSLQQRMNKKNESHFSKSEIEVGRLLESNFLDNLVCCQCLDLEIKYLSNSRL